MIYLGADKNGIDVILIAQKWLQVKKVENINLGVTTKNEDIKLEILLPKVAAAVKADEKNLAIVSCGTGVGVEVGINKFSGIRACLATNPEIAKWSKIYDKCNVLCLPGWKIDQQLIEEILIAWFSAEYDGSESRLQMFAEFDTWH